MKKRIITLTILIFICFAQSAYSFEWGCGYNSGFSFRVWWNDIIGSELSYEPDLRQYVESELERYWHNIYLTPLNIAVYKNDNQRISLGVKFEMTIFYEKSPGYKGKLYLHQYAIFFMLPEIEVKIPIEQDVRFIGNVGYIIEWGYDDHGDLDRIRNGFYGLQLYNMQFGLVHFF